MVITVEMVILVEMVITVEMVIMVIPQYRSYYTLGHLLALPSSAQSVIIAPKKRVASIS